MTDRTLTLYDSFSRLPRSFHPGPGKPLRVYSCGPTVYDLIHVGNARPFVVAMTLKRHLERSGVPVKLVINITDVNDKIYDAAARAGRSSDEHARLMRAAYVADTDRLGLGRPDVEPLVTDSIPEVVDMIARLIEGGHAYAAGGDVYFRVASFETYGSLSGQRVDELREAEPGDGKESPLDFALWKGRKPGEDTWWDSPWGPGRPGWHIECSAMAMKHLGDEVDVHGGGLDLIFPHHENERAQSEGVTAGRFVHAWMHNGMLRFGGEKMAKSVGNVAKLRDALDVHGPTRLLLLLASAHYRSPLDYTDEALESARAAGESFREAFRALRRAGGDGSGDAALLADAERCAADFDAALDDDLNTPIALRALHELRAAVNRAVAAESVSATTADGVAALFRTRLDVLGLAEVAEVGATVPEDVAGLAGEREAARRAGDYGRADELRAAILARGFVVRDGPDGPELVPG
jgi:cysteinyl-tRNA synthetase